MKNSIFSRYYFLYWLLGVSTLLMIWIGAKFSINDFVSHPQFENFIHFDECMKLIGEKGKTRWFTAFFVLDFLWAALLLVGMFRIIRSFYNDTKARSLFFFVLFAVPAYIFDAVENFMYLSSYHENLELIVRLKKITYLLASIVFLYNLYKRFVHDKNRNIYFFLKTSSLSILIILVITLLITMVDQGGTILVQLLSEWHQVAFTFFLLNFLVIIVSHYPIYMQIWNVLDEPFEPDGLRLVMAKTTRVILGFGIIYFIPQGDKEYDPFITKFLRRSLGVLLYISMFYVVFFVANKYFEWELSVIGITALITVLILLFFYFMEKTKEKYDDVLDGRCAGDKLHSAQKLTLLLQWYPQVLLSGLLSVLIAAIISYIYSWSVTTVITILIVLILNAFSYIYFRLSRSYLRYIFYSEELMQSNPKLIKDEVLKYFQNSNKPKYAFFNNLIFRTGQKLAYLSDNRKYLRFMRFGGLFSLICLICLNAMPMYGFFINPLNVILLYIIFYYSIIIILLKHLLYYNKTELPEGEKPPFSSFFFFQPIFKYLFPVLLVVLVGWGFYSTSIGNDLHTLTLVEEDNKSTPQTEVRNNRKLVDTETFVRNFDPYIKKDTANTFFVGSYGGGLKANLWNLLILNKLNEEEDFFKNTVCLSGVSGGAIGIGNYTRVYENYDSYNERRKANVGIGESNLLSSEIAFLLGADFIRRYIPVNDLFKDRGRSYYSMKQHAKLTGALEDFNTKSFRTQWSALFAKKKYYPAIIINSTSTKGKQGVALSVFTKDTVVPAADDILVFSEPDNGVSLTYFGALSTSNRFPLLSPAAKIEGKGYYLDGGYFENSGLLSAGEFRNYILPRIRNKKEFDSIRINPVFVNIINSKDYYALLKLREWEVELDPTNGLASGEISAILSTLVSTEKLPRYVTEAIVNEDDEAVVKVFMPHKLDYAYITRILGGEPKAPLILISKLEAHNNRIDSVLNVYKPYKLKQWGVVTPPLSRLLGEAAVKYQEAMVNSHPEVIRSLKHLIKRIKPE
ncbi:hypothetical protein ACJD0Z_10270 [Flavobacteriaceae bacterium M23B6Z8]